MNFEDKIKNYRESTVVRVCLCGKEFINKLKKDRKLCRACTENKKRAELRQRCRDENLCYNCLKKVEPKFPSRCERCRNKIHSKVKTQV
jgi:hypothetical protein